MMLGVRSGHALPGVLSAKLRNLGLQFEIRDEMLLITPKKQHTAEGPRGR